MKLFDSKRKAPKFQSVPKHIAVVMDGNGRWANARGLKRTEGHKAGELALLEVVAGAIEAGVEQLTAFAFSTENWNRPKEEVDALMELLVNTILNEVPSLNSQGIRLKFIGDRSALPTSCLNAILESEERTAANDTLQLTLALSYSARWEMVEAVKKIVKMLDKGKKNDLSLHRQAKKSVLLVKKRRNA